MFGLKCSLTCPLSRFSAHRNAPFFLSQIVVVFGGWAVSINPRVPMDYNTSETIGLCTFAALQNLLLLFTLGVEWQAARQSSEPQPKPTTVVHVQAWTPPQLPSAAAPRTCTLILPLSIAQHDKALQHLKPPHKQHHTATPERRSTDRFLYAMWCRRRTRPEVLDAAGVAGHFADAASAGAGLTQ